MNNDPAPARGNGPNDEWFGHPQGLFYLFFAEMWERFCYYGMRAILTLYMTSYFLYGDARANGVYGAYCALVYCMAVFGGFFADRFLGYRRSIMMGGILMAIGEFLLLVNRQLLGFVGLPLGPDLESLFFFGGMATIVVGNGFFKPNISTIVGKLYAPGDRRRDAGFTIFYMGINVGALAGGVICGWIGETISWPLGFGLAGLGMLLGIFTFARGEPTLRGQGAPPAPERRRAPLPLVLAGSLASIPLFGLLLKYNELVGYVLYTLFVIVLGLLVKVAIGESKAQRERMFALIFLIVFNIVFWMFFEQAGSSLTLFAKRNLDRGLGFGLELPASVVQQFNPVFIILLAPLFAALWMRLGRRKREPSIPAKFALGMVQIAAAFGVLVVGARIFSTDGITPLVFVVLLYLLQTTGELCLSPVGLSMVTKLAPARITGMVMGAWFLSMSMANYLAGEVAKLTAAAGGEAGEGVPPAESLAIYTGVYQKGALILAAAGVVLFLLIPLLRKWMHGVD